MSFEFVEQQNVLTDEVLPEIAKAETLAFDVETRGKDPYASDLLLGQLATPNQAWVFDARKLELAPLFDILRQTNPLIIGHNLKFDIAVTMRLFQYVPERTFDTMIAYGLINNGLDNPFVPLQHLVRIHADVKLNKDVRESFARAYGELTDLQIEYAANDVLYLHKIFRNQLERLQADNLIGVAQLEFQLIPMVIEMELAGVLLDSESWVTAAQNLYSEATQLEIEIGKLVDGTAVQTSFLNTPKSTFNPRSAKQVKAHLHSLGFEVKSTGYEVLKRIDHPFARLVPKYREIYTLASRYGPNFLQYIQEDGRIHANFHQQGTQSGRLSSSKPNLQNIPSAHSYRKCFIAPDGSVIITADFSQIELKVAAILSGEPRMIEEYKKKDSDLHKLTAAGINGIDLIDVTEIQRFEGKTTNFSVMYNISKYALARRLGCSLDKADKLIKGFMNTYPTLAAYMQRQAVLGLTQGYTATKLGRRRYYAAPPLNSSSYERDVAKIKRIAANNVIQGTAADILKRAMVKLYDGLRPYEAKLINTIHDEFVVEVPIGSTSQVVGVVSNCMEDAGTEMMGDEIPWSISIAVGGHWKKT